MQLVVHGSEPLRLEIQSLFEEHAYVHVLHPEETNQAATGVVHLAETAGDLGPSSEKGLAVVLREATGNEDLVHCPRAKDGSLPLSLVRLIESVGAPNFTLRARLDEFISVFHHDISEPARNMSFFAQFLNSERGTDEEKRKDLLQRMHVSGERLQLLVADLTNYARTWVKEKPNEALSAETVKGLCEEAFEQSKKDAERLFEELEMDEVEGVWAPAKHLSAIFRELFANALEFHSDEGEPIRLSIHRNERTGLIEFAVLDDGPGITDPGEGRLFRPFYRGQRDDELRTGMGLAMVRALVEGAGGDVWVEGLEGRKTCVVYFSLHAL